MRRMKIRIISMLVVLAMVLGLVPVMSGTEANADGEQYEIKIVCTHPGSNCTREWDLGTHTLPYTIDASYFESIMIHTNAMHGGQDLPNPYITNVSSSSSGLTTGDNNHELKAIAAGTHGFQVHFSGSSGVTGRIAYGNVIVTQESSPGPEPSHTHTFTYSASGSRLTAACTESSCNLHSGITVEMLAPASLTYNGNTHPVRFNDNNQDDAFYNATGYRPSSCVEYFKVNPDNSEYSIGSGAPTDHYKYKAKIKIGEATASITFSIAKATPTVETLPTASEITFGDTLSSSTLTGGSVTLEGQNVSGYFMWKSGSTQPKGSDSETTAFDAIFVPDDGDNIDNKIVGVKLKVNKLPIGEDAVTAPTPLELTYNGSNQELITAGTVDGGYMVYALGGETTPPDESSYSKTVPKGKKAGKYYVYWKAVADESHDFGGSNVSGTIGTEIYKAKSEVTEKPEGKTGLVYNGEDQILLESLGKASGGTMYFAHGPVDTYGTEPAFDGDSDVPENDKKWHSSSKIPTGKIEGTYVIWYMVKGDENHENTSPDMLTVSMTKRDDHEDTTDDDPKDDDKKDDDSKKDDDTKTDDDSKKDDTSKDDSSKDSDKKDTSSKAVYRNTKGANAKWTSGSKNGLTFVFKRDKDDSTTRTHFQGIRVDKLVVPVGYYNVTNGSVVIELIPDYLWTLKAGEHTLTAVFDDGDDVSVKFTTIKKAGDESNYGNNGNGGSGSGNGNSYYDKYGNLVIGANGTGNTASATDAYGNSTKTGDGMDLVIMVLVMIVAFLAALCVLKSKYIMKFKMTWWN